MWLCVTFSDPKLMAPQALFLDDHALQAGGNTYWLIKKIPRERLLAG